MTSAGHDAGHREPAHGPARPDRGDPVPAGVPAPWLLVTGGLLAGIATAAVLGWRWDLPAAIVLAFAAVPLVVYDLRQHRLPDRIVAPAALAVLVALVGAAAAQSQWADLVRGLAASLVSGTGYLVLALLRPTGLGLGDVKLGTVLGLWLGWLGWAHLVTGVMAAVILGGLWAVVLVVTGRARAGDAMPFGPWLLAGAAVATIWTEELTGGLAG